VIRRPSKGFALLLRLVGAEVEVEEDKGRDATADACTVGHGVVLVVALVAGEEVAAVVEKAAAAAAPMVVAAEVEATSCAWACPCPKTTGLLNARWWR
jgi:hypothetical protein